jgi:branched-chain amino acid transport system permease protein
MMERQVQFIQLVISGIAQGCIYGLIALGFVPDSTRRPRR